MAFFKREASPVERFETALKLKQAERRKLATRSVAADKLLEELCDLDEQIVATERALADARAQRDRELLADQIEALAGAIDRAVPGFGAGAAALMQSINQNP